MKKRVGQSRGTWLGSHVNGGQLLIQSLVNIGQTLTFSFNCKSVVIIGHLLIEVSFKSLYDITYI